MASVESASERAALAFGRLRQQVAGALSPAPQLRLPPATPPHGSSPTVWERLKPHLPLIVLLASLTLIAVARYLEVRQHIDMGPDVANYLTTMNTFFGNDVAGNGLLRPPLIALPLKALTLVFGELTGVKLLGVLISVGIGLPFYLIARRVSYPWIAVASSVLFVLTPAYANMLSWGYITMFGIFFTLLAVYFFVRILEAPTKWNIILAALSASFVIGFHQLTAAFFVPLLVILVLALLLLNRDQLRQNMRPFTAALVLAAVCCLPYVPVYLHLLEMQSSQGGEAGLSATPFLDFASGVWYARWLWAVFPGIVLALASLVWLRRFDRTMATLLGVLLVFPLALTFFTLPPPFVELNRRAQYFLYVPLWAVAGFALSLLWSWRPSALRSLRPWLPRLAVAAITLPLLISAALTSQQELRKGLDYYAYLDDARWAAVQWIGQNTPEGAIVAAYPENMGWWIEGVARREVFEVTERNMEANIMEKKRSFVAELMFSRNRGLSNGHVRLATSYPYTDLPGNPVIGFYVGGRYQDLLMFDDNQSSIRTAGGGTMRLAELPPPEFSLSGDGARMQMVIIYRLGDATVTQTATLVEGSQSAIITYAVQSGGQAITQLCIPSIFCYEPVATPAVLQDGSIEVVQQLETPFDRTVPVTTRLGVEAAGAALQLPGTPADRIPLTFDITGAEATITLSFDISSTTAPPNSEQVSAYEIPRLIRDHGISYLAIDFKPDSAIWSDMPLGLQEWLDGCPYYALAHSEGDVRIYEVVPAALP